MLKALPDDIPVVKMGVKGHPKITDEHVVVIETALAKGFPYALIADLIGIAKSKLSEWLSRRPHIQERLKKAEALHITKNLDVLALAREKNWQASAWLLERRHKEHFGQQQQVNLAGAVANVHFTAADAAVLVAATRADFAGKSTAGQKVIHVTPSKKGKSIVGDELHLKDKAPE